MTIRLRPSDRHNHQHLRVYACFSGPLMATSQLLHIEYCRSKHNIITLIIPNNEAFEMYLQWTKDRIIYSNAAPLKYKDEMQAKSMKGESDYVTLLRLHMLGSYLCDTLFMDITISLLDDMLNPPDTNVDTLVRAPDPGALKQVWDNTTEAADIPRRLLDMIVQ